MIVLLFFVSLPEIILFMLWIEIVILQALGGWLTDGSEVLECNIKHCPLWLFRKKWFKIPRRVFDGDKRLKKS